MKKNSVFTILLKILGVFVLSWLMWLLVFSIFTPEDYEDVVEPFRGASFIFGLITCLFVYTGFSYNTIFRRKQSIRARASNIIVVEERSESLLSKANHVVEKYQKHEHETLTSIGTAVIDVKAEKLVGNAAQFQSFIQSYPELKANSNVLELLKQIKECENTTANFKIEYNAEVEHYNSLIHTFPINLLRKRINLEDEQYYSEKDTAKDIDDELLGF